MSELKTNDKQTKWSMKHVITIITVLFMTAMVGMTFVNAILRYFVGKSIMSFEEYSRFAFVWISYVGCIIAFKNKRHICVTLITDLVKGKTKIILEILGELVVLVTCCVIFIAGLYYFKRACTYYTAATNTNFGLIVGGLPLMALSMMWIQLKDMIGKYVKKNAKGNGGEETI